MENLKQLKRSDMIRCASDLSSDHWQIILAGEDRIRLRCALRLTLDWTEKQKIKFFNKLDEKDAIVIGPYLALDENSRGKVKKALERFNGDTYIQNTMKGLRNYPKKFAFKQIFTLK